MRVEIGDFNIVAYGLLKNDEIWCDDTHRFTICAGLHRKNGEILWADLNPGVAATKSRAAYVVIAKGDCRDECLAALKSVVESAMVGYL